MPFFWVASLLSTVGNKKRYSSLLRSHKCYICLIYISDCIWLYADQNLWMRKYVAKNMKKYNYALIGNFVINSLIIDSYIWGSASFLYFAQPLEWTRVLVLSHWSITFEPSVQVSPRKDPRYKLCSYYIQIIIHLKYRGKVDTVHFYTCP